MMTDLEGVSGVKGRSDDIGNKIINMEQACRLLTGEVNATVEGLTDAGAEEIVVVDGHGGSNCINIEDLHPKASLRTYESDIEPVTCINVGCDAAIQIGAHALMGVKDGFMNHSFNSRSVAGMWLNNTLVGEIAFEALTDAYFGVPTILVSGDSAACREARDFLGEVETVETKTGLSRYSAINRNPSIVRDELRKAAGKALKNKDRCPARNISPPYTLKIQLMCPNQADIYEQRGAKRLDHQTVALESDDLLDLLAQRRGWAPGVHKAKFKDRPAES